MFILFFLTLPKLTFLFPRREEELSSMRELEDYGIDINAVQTRNGETRNQNPIYEEEDDDRTVRERSYTPEDTIEQSSRPSSSRPQSSQNASHPLALPRSNSQSNQHSQNQQSNSHHQNNNNNNNNNSYRDEPSSYRNNTQSSQRQNATGSVYSDGYTHDDDATVITYSDSDVDV